MYEVKVSCEKTDENGKQKRVKEVYMFDAVSVTDAETRAIETLSRRINWNCSGSGTTILSMMPGRSQSARAGSA